MTLAKLALWVTETYAVTEDDLKSRRRTKLLTDARAVLCHLAIENLRLSGVQLADYLYQARSSVSRAERRGRLLLEVRPELLQALLGN